MDAVEKRVKERMTLETRQTRAEQMTLGKRRKALGVEADRAVNAVTKLVGTLKDGDTAHQPKAIAESGTKALKSLPRTIKALERVNEQMAKHADALATLEDKDEFDRRVKHAREMGVTEKPLTGVGAAEIVLIRRGKATHVTDITREVLESGLVKLSGKTPEQTMSAYLAKEAAKTGGKFVRVEPGVFDLRTREAEPTAA